MKLELKFKPVLFFTILVFVMLRQCEPNRADLWADDFKFQPLTGRPALEVNYTDASRTSFQILAEAYTLTGQLEQPHLLRDKNGKEWLWMEITDEQGQVYSTRNSNPSSRINLYRRGPYFCEVHWFDMQPTTEDGEASPLRGDLTLYCYPEKVLAEIAWHAVEDFQAAKIRIKGIAPVEFECGAIARGNKKVFHFPLYGEEEALPEDAFTTLEGTVPLKYNRRKGYYEIGTITSSSFQKQFYDFPNRYETARFSIRNDDKARKIYIGHTSVEGGAIVEGGMVLDEGNHPMPLVVQVSKNFGGEKEEKFYNPLDTAFSETFFPLYLEPGESQTLSSLHLYQNWGRHMTKHWSSLGAWMDYFHSSTGVTETTCYVPFKFAGIGGVAIADFRAMSQEAFWSGQPQHDNLAGHSFLSYYDGKQWQHSKYESTIYRSTGPNWYDIQMNYTTADSSIRITADIWETPQVDELRSFFKVRYEVLKPLSIADATVNFRFLTITSAIQQHRFTRVAATGMEDQEIDFSKTFPVKGHPLPAQNAFLAKFGDHTKDEWGSNAIVIREFKGPEGIGPAVTLQAGPYLDRFKDALVQIHKFNDQAEDTRLFLAPDVEELDLRPGDVFEIDGFWLPYGPVDDAVTPRRESSTYGKDLPRVTSCSKGRIVSHLPVCIEAEDNRAEFSLLGGRDLLPVIVNGLSEWKNPRIWKKEGEHWRLLSHARNWENDGYQVFAEEGGSFGAVFLVHSDEREQTLKVEVGYKGEEEPQLVLDVLDEDRKPGGIGFGKSLEEHEITLIFPGSSGDSPLSWQRSEGNSLWFESAEVGWSRGGRINPNQEDLDLEYWWQNREEGLKHQPPEFLLDLSKGSFRDVSGERTWVFQKGEWIAAAKAEISDTPGLKAIAVQSAKSGQILCLAWPKARHFIWDPSSGLTGIALEPVEFAQRRRYHLRGRLQLTPPLLSRRKTSRHGARKRRNLSHRRPGSGNPRAACAHRHLPRRVTQFRAEWEYDPVRHEHVAGVGTRRRFRRRRGEADVSGATRIRAGTGLVALPFTVTTARTPPESADPSRSFAHFTAPSVTRLVSWDWRTKNTISRGRAASSSPADRQGAFVGFSGCLAP